MVLNHVIWNPDPEIFSIGSLAVRWYGLLFALSFVLGYIIMQQFFNKEGVPLKLLDKLATYMVISTIIGARLGHCLFYEPDKYLSNPIDILKIWEGGLASHGAAIGILLALYLFSRKTKKPYFWTVDRIVIVVALAGFFIRAGNLMNSEIYGDETKKNYGFVYVRDFDENLKSIFNLEKTDYIKPSDKALHKDFNFPVEVQMKFPSNVTDTNTIALAMQRNVRWMLSPPQAIHLYNLYWPETQAFEYNMQTANRTGIQLDFTVASVPRHPTQIYEALAYLLIFLLLLGFYYMKNGKPVRGVLFAWFLILIFTARFIIEYFKMPQVAFEEGMTLNMGQWLSIPFVLAGVIILFYSYHLNKKRIGKVNN